MILSTLLGLWCAWHFGSRWVRDARKRSRRWLKSHDLAGWALLAGFLVVLAKGY